MVWDDNKSSGDGLTANEWNSMVDDQKARNGLIFDAYNSTSTNVDTTWMTPQIDTVVHNTNSDFTLSSGEVTFGTAGTYLVIARTSLEQNSDGDRATSQATLDHDDGSGFTNISGTKGLMYNRTDPESDNSTTIQCVLTVSSGDKIRMRARMFDTTTSNRCQTFAEGCRLTLIRLF